MRVAGVILHTGLCVRACSASGFKNRSKWFCIGRVIITSQRSGRQAHPTRAPASLELLNIYRAFIPSGIPISLLLGRSGPRQGHQAVVSQRMRYVGFTSVAICLAIHESKREPSVHCVCDPELACAARCMADRIIHILYNVLRGTPRLPFLTSKWTGSARYGDICVGYDSFPQAESNAALTFRIRKRSAGNSDRYVSPVLIFQLGCRLEQISAAVAGLCVGGSSHLQGICVIAGHRNWIVRTRPANVLGGSRGRVGVHGEVCVMDGWRDTS